MKLWAVRTGQSFTEATLQFSGFAFVRSFGGVSDKCTRGGWREVCGGGYEVRDRRSLSLHDRISNSVLLSYSANGWKRIAVLRLGGGKL